MSNNSSAKIDVRIKVNGGWPIVFPSPNKTSGRVVTPNEILRGICQESSGWHNSFGDGFYEPPVPIVVMPDGRVIFPSSVGWERREFNDTIAKVYALQNDGAIYIPSKGQGSLEFSSFIEAVRRIAARPEINEGINTWAEGKGAIAWAGALKSLAAEGKHLKEITLWYDQPRRLSGCIGEVVAERGTLPSETRLDLCFSNSDDSRLNFEPCAKMLSSHIDVPYMLDLRKGSLRAGTSAETDALTRYFREIARCNERGLPYMFSLNCMIEGGEEGGRIDKFLLRMCTPGEHSENKIPIPTPEMFKPYLEVYNKVVGAIERLENNRKSIEEAKSAELERIVRGEK